MFFPRVFPRMFAARICFRRADGSEVPLLALEARLQARLLVLDLLDLPHLSQGGLGDPSARGTESRRSTATAERVSEREPIQVSR